mmetsp:Transcript_68964/g.109428  ORF Transcript_68964/g.109428 Transcript_68964/m.109428 type:complete len:530 (-) Transcript_68964:146-1735(-)
MSRRNREQSGNIRWDSDGAAYFCGGEGCPWVPMSMHRSHRDRLCASLREELKDRGVNSCSHAFIFLAGGSEQSMYDTDVEWDMFRQESNFQYLFGVKESGCLGFIRIEDGWSVLLVPRLAPVYATWMGPIKPPAWFHRAYGVDEVAFVDEASEVLKRLYDSEAKSSSVASQQLLIYKGTNRDSGLTLPAPSFEGLNSDMINDDLSKVLYEQLGECRNIKSPEELKILQYVNDISSIAHIEVMRAIRGGQRERLSETTFRYHASLRGCHRVGYTCICPTGTRNQVLHYGHPGEPNAELVESEALTLHDMGCEYHCYTADVTITFPVGGKFTADQKLVYEAVWAATEAVERSIKPGVCYKDMHRLAQRTLLTEMKAAGLFVGEVDDMMAIDLAGRFMPHGLGHCLGLDVHDVAGYAPGKNKSDDPSMRQNLRCGRDLIENMVITVEPGFYFNDYLLAEMETKPEEMKFVNKERLDELRPVGGVRIEDDVVITATGCRVLTCVPRAVEDIEAVMAGHDWVISQANCREYVAK